MLKRMNPVGTGAIVLPWLSRVVQPLTTYNAASVTANGTTLSLATMTPTTSPITVPVTSPAAMPAARLPVLVMIHAPATPPAPITLPVDRSIPPVRITNVAPIAAIPTTADWLSTLIRFDDVRRPSVSTLRTRISRISAGSIARSANQPGRRAGSRSRASRTAPAMLAPVAVAAAEAVEAVEGSAAESSTRADSGRTAPHLRAGRAIVGLVQDQPLGLDGLRRDWLAAKRRGDRGDRLLAEVGHGRGDVGVQRLGLHGLAAVLVTVDGHHEHLLGVADGHQPAGCGQRR